MPEIKPFCALRYDAGKVRIADVVAPPYDVISPDHQTQLYDRSRYNVVRLILGREEDRYTEARTSLLAWKEEQILTRDETEAIYFLTQSFVGPDGISHTRRGFIAVCRVEEFQTGAVLPHEKTLSKPKEDRLKLAQAARTNLSQIFSIYSDPENKMGELLDRGITGAPLIEVEYEGVLNRLWRSADEPLIRDVMAAMKGRTVLIADGHHRYETALAYRDLMRIKTGSGSDDAPFSYTMMFFSSMDDRGLVVFPTHRLVHSLDGFDAGALMTGLGEHFDITPYGSRDSLLESLISRREFAYGVIERGGYHLAVLKDRRSLKSVIGSQIPPEVRELDVTLLHSYVLEDLLKISHESQERKEHLEYVKNVEEADEAIQSGRAQLAFLMNATKLEQIRRVAKAGHTMPQKSTFFYPKLLSGLLLYPLE